MIAVIAVVCCTFVGVLVGTWVISRITRGELVAMRDDRDRWRTAAEETEAKRQTAVEEIARLLYNNESLADEAAKARHDALGLQAQLVKAKSDAVDPEALELMHADLLLLAAIRLLLTDEAELMDGNLARRNQALALLLRDDQEGGEGK